MMKSHTARFAALVLIAAASTWFVADQVRAGGKTAPRTFAVGAKHFRYSTRPFSMGGCLMVPVKETMKALGVKTSGGSQRSARITFTSQGRKVILSETSGLAQVGKEKWTLDRPATRRKSDVFVPASFIKRLDSRYSIKGM